MRYLSLALVGLFFGSLALSQPTTAPSTQPDGPMKVYITEVKGLVRVRDNETQPWRAAVAHTAIAQGAELQTGPRSSVTCVILPDQTFTLDRLGTVRVEEAAKHGDKITTDLIMKYGRTHYEIEAAGLEHEASIISPSSTLAVRGTSVDLFDQPPYKPEATSFTGRAIFTNGYVIVPVGEKNGSLAKAVAGETASETELTQTVVNPRYGPSLTAADQALIATQVSRGAVLSYDPVANIPVIKNGIPSFDSQLPAGLPGSLDFVLRWTGNANLNIEVGVAIGDPESILANGGFNANEFLYPGWGYQNSPSGGHIPFDNRGGPTGGEEIAYWTGNFPTGIYGVAAQSISGVATKFTLDVYLNKVAIPMILLQDDGSLIKSTQFTRILQPGDNFAPIVIIPPDDNINGLATDDPLGNPNPGITAGDFQNATPAAKQTVVKKTKPFVSGPITTVQAPGSAAKPAAKTK